MCKVKRPYNRGGGPSQLHVQVQGPSILTIEESVLYSENIKPYAYVLCRNKSFTKKFEKPGFPGKHEFGM